MSDLSVPDPIQINEVEALRAEVSRLRAQNAALQAAQSEARAGDARMRAIVENLHDGLLITDLDDVITYANGRISEMCGYSNAELLGQNAHQLLTAPEIWPECERRNLERARGASETYEIPLRHKNGGTVWALINGSPLRDASGTITGTIGAHFDITQRKAAETERAQFARQLEQSNRDLEAFAYVVSHDLKEPLRKIEAFGSRLETLDGARLGEESRDALARMRGAATRMGALIDGLLLYSRAASKETEFSWVELGESAREAMLDLEASVAGARVEIGDLPRVYADPTQMRQLLQNLLGNALKYRRPNVPLRVRVAGGSSGNCCWLEVADNGRGFESAEAEAIFEIFRRAPQPKNEAVPGAGVGLTICRKIVERHGGRIGASSNGGGAVFRVEMPLP